MKTIIKCVAAASLGAIALFACRQEFNIRSLFNPGAKAVQARASHSVFLKPGAQVRQVVPDVMASNNQMHSTKIALHDHCIAAKLIKKRRRVSAMLVPETFAAVTHADKACNSKNAKTLNTAIAHNATAEKNISTSQPVKEEPDQYMTTAAKTGGCSYEGKVKAEKVYVKSTTQNIAAFASLKQTDNAAESYSYTAVFDASEYLKEYAVNNGNNTDYAIIINQCSKPGKKRLFVVDLATSTIIKNTMIATGSIDSVSANEMESMNAFTGLFKIDGHDSNGAYMLYGLQKFNSSSSGPSIMLQSAENGVGNEADFPQQKMDGNLLLAANVFNQLSLLFNKSEKPVLLWIGDLSAKEQPSYSVVQAK